VFVFFLIISLLYLLYTYTHIHSFYQTKIWLAAISSLGLYLTKTQNQFFMWYFNVPISLLLSVDQSWVFSQWPINFHKFRTQPRFWSIGKNGCMKINLPYLKSVKTASLFHQFFLLPWKYIKQLNMHSEEIHTSPLPMCVVTWKISIIIIRNIKLVKIRKINLYL